MAAPAVFDDRTHEDAAGRAIDDLGALFDGRFDPVGAEPLRFADDLPEAVGVNHAVAEAVQRATDVKAGGKVGGAGSRSWPGGKSASPASPS